MNNRIASIAERVGVLWLWQEDIKYTTMTAEQFNMVTELIVKECGTWLNDYIGGEYSQEATQELHRHFGVK